MLKQKKIIITLKTTNVRTNGINKRIIKSNRGTGSLNTILRLKLVSRKIKVHKVIIRPTLKYGAEK